MVQPIYDDNYNPADLKVAISELLVATADGSDELLDGSVPEVLKLLRQHMNMDVVFVSEFTGGERVFRHVDTAPGADVLAAGQSDPLEQSWCQRVVDGRLPQMIQDATFLPADAAPRPPFPIGSHLSTPVVLKDGSVYGTLCCFSFTAHASLAEQDLKKLQYTAKLTAAKIDQAAAKKNDDATKDWSLVPKPREAARAVR
jgi:GAF domain-containing protein